MQHGHKNHKAKKKSYPETSKAELEPSPADFVDKSDSELTKKGQGRRSILRLIWKTAVGGAVVSGLAKIADIEGFFQFTERVRHGFDHEVDPRLLESLFGIGSNLSAALVPAANHPFKPPSNNADWYPIEGECCATYKDRFAKGMPIRSTKDYPEIKDDDTLVLFGSQVSNLLTRKILGNPWKNKPLLSIHGPHWRTKLIWNLHSPPEATLIKRQQFGSLWITKNHVIVGASGDRYQPKSTETGLDDDYLLVTAFPRWDRGPQKIIVFAAGHGPGTKAANLLLRTPPVKDLRKIEEKIGKNEPFYQALFHVNLTKDDSGETIPSAVELVDAKRLRILFH